MKIYLSSTLDTAWSNAVTVKVEVDLDNGHDLTQRHLATEMVAVLELFCEEVRAETERRLYAEGMEQRKRDADRREADRREADQRA